MKKFFTALCLAFVGSLCAVLAACTNKDSKLTLSFEVNGGTEISSVQLGKDEQYTLPVPVKDGYEFEGWYLTDNLTGSSVTDVTVTENVTYYAKWSKLYTVSLDAVGGNLSMTSLKLKEGANLFEALKTITPTKNDYQFDAWLNGETAVILNTRMPASDVTLTARYKVKYSVEIYKQELATSSYVKDESVVEGYGYVGETISPDLSNATLTGFTQAENADAVMSRALSASAGENVFKFYFDREKYTVAFHTNYPDGTDEVVKTQEDVKFGESVAIPNDITVDGYCLAGWALSASGELVYPVDAISDNLFNSSAQGGDDYEKSFTPDKDMGLYAVWIKGYVDLLGVSKDTIFVIGDDSDVAYLCRAGKYFVSEKFSSVDSIIFSDEASEIFFECKLLENGKFVYFSDARSVATYDCYEVSLKNDKASPKITDTKQLHFDGFDGVTYTVQGKDGITSSSNGTFSLDENGFYVCSFHDGELAGQTVTYWLTEVLNNGVTTSVFLARNQEELELGTIYRAVFAEMQLTYYLSLYRIEFNGFGMAAYYGSSTSTQPSNYFCFFNDDRIVLASINEFFGEIVLTEIVGEKCYLVYNKDNDFKATQGTDTLNLDGCGNAVYKTADGETKGYYQISQSGFGDYLVKLFSNGEELANFIVSNTADEETTPTYTFVSKPKGYAEYNYTNDKYIYTATYLVLNEESEGTASIYCSDADNKTYKVSTGTYQEVSGLYVYSKVTWNVPEGVTVPFETTEFSSFVFTLGTKSANNRQTYYVNYWTEYTVGEEKVELYSEYKCGKDILQILNFGRVAMYKAESDKAYKVGDYTLTDGVLTFTVSRDNYYFALNEDGKTFEKLAFTPYTVNALTEKLEVNNNTYISFSGKVTSEDELKCTYNTVADDESVNTVEGKVISNADNGVYTFVSDDGLLTFNFKMFTASSKTYVSLYNDVYAGQYVSQSGILTLDGYGSAAVLNGSSNMYLVADENVIAIRTADGYTYIDLNTADKSFTIRGKEYGTYLYSDNQYMNGYYFHFDGYGNLSVYKMVNDESDGYKREYIDEHGVYEIENEMVTVKYANGNIEINRKGKFDTYTYSSTVFNTFVFSYDDIAHTYVSKDDWSVITLDGNGNAVKNNTYGVEESGSYIIVSDKLFYYVNDNSSDAAIYKYDIVAGTATPLKLRARGYYTSEMESLLFSKYGFAIFNGKTRYYYDIDNSNVVIYRRAEEGEIGANEFGFIRQDFGRLTETTITFEDKTYIYNDGYAITFNRNAEGKDNYPLPINLGTDEEPKYVTLTKVVFTPSGDNEDYSVNGVAVVNDTNYDCKVSRQIDDNGDATYYVTVGVFRFEVAFEYGGLIKDEGNNEISASKFSVVGLSKINTLYSDTYLLYYYIYSMFGMTLPNSWGNLQLVEYYNEVGESIKQVVNMEFGSGTTAFDTNGDLIKISNTAYIYDEESGLYTVEFEYIDGYKYTLCFSIELNSIFNMNAYKIVYLTREQVLTDNDYEVKIETLLLSDLYRATAGVIYNVSLVNGETEIPFTGGLTITDGIYYISREFDENNKITAVEYYKLSLLSNEISENNKSVPTYSAVTVSKLEAVSTYYDEANTSYIDIDTVENKILAIFMYDEEAKKTVSYLVTSCEYSETTSKYTIILSSGKSYSVSIKDGKVTFTEISVEGDTSEDNGNN